jgi:hypothetical protein
LVTGRQIIETAAQMSAADLSVLISAVQQSDDEGVVLITSAGSANDRLWHLMTEKGWMIDRGNPRPELPITMASYSIRPEFRPQVWAIASVCFEGRRKGMTPEEIIAFGEGEPDQRLAHLL